MTENRLSVNLSLMRKKTTVYIEDELLRAAKMAAVREGKKEYQVFEEALRSHLGIQALESVWSRSELTEGQALRLANAEVHSARKARRRTRRA